MPILLYNSKTFHPVVIATSTIALQEQLLSDEEERQLADRIKVGDARALEQLTKANLRFVVSLAHHYRGHGLDEDDLVSEGNIALMHLSLIHI